MLLEYYRHRPYAYSHLHDDESFVVYARFQDLTWMGVRWTLDAMTCVICY
jgi:hypothetical protein